MKPITTVLFSLLAIAAAGLFIWGLQPPPMTTGRSTQSPGEFANWPEGDNPAHKNTKPATNPAPAPTPVVAQNRRPQMPVVKNNPEPVAILKAPEFRTGPDAVDFGEVEISDGLPVQFDLNTGQYLVITPAVLRDGTLKLTLAVRGMRHDGTTTTMSTPNIYTRSGKPVDVILGPRKYQISVHLTPMVVGTHVAGM